MADSHSDSVLPFYLKASKGRLFCLYISPGNQGQCDAAVVHLPAFAEEMNKSRFLVCQQARTFAKSGTATLIVDYFGTGDSDGIFREAEWETWVADVDIAVEWIHQQGVRQISLWGSRIGSAVALEAAERGNFQIQDLIMWQPVLNGNVFLKQFLRLRRAAELFNSPVNEAENEWSGDSEVMEVAGYELTSDMRTSLELIEPKKKSPDCKRAAIFEVSSMQPPVVSRPVKKLSEKWDDGNLALEVRAVYGEPFWSTSEIVTNADLLKLTEAFLVNGRHE